MRRKKLNLTIHILDQFFGDGFVWASRTAELVGFNREKNLFVIIEDGQCFDDSWLYQLWDFNGAECTAEEWFFNNYKYCCDNMGATILKEEWFTGFESMYECKTSTGFEFYTRAEIDEMKRQGKKCFEIPEDIDYHGGIITQYDIDDFAGFYQDKEGKWITVDGKTLEEVQSQMP